jgi:uncharacterized protein YdhG (YjbR/CyaY superfamily)
MNPMATAKPTTIDEYIAQYSKDVQKILQEIRATVRKAAPMSEEKISYGIPTFTLAGKYLVYFAAYKNHIGVYPVPNNNKAFEKDFARYKTSGKGTIQFPLDAPIPYNLVAKIVAFRMKERAAKEKKSKAAKK